MKNKVLAGLGLGVVILLVWVSSLANIIARKDGEIKLLSEKLATSESVNQGLKNSVEKLIEYNECIAKIFIAPRSLDKALAGSIDDPAAALKRCRIEVSGVPVSENPEAPSVATGQTQPTTPSSPSSPANDTPSRPSNNPPSSNPPSNPPPEEPPPPPPAPPAPGLVDQVEDVVCDLPLIPCVGLPL